MSYVLRRKEQEEGGRKEGRKRRDTRTRHTVRGPFQAYVVVAKNMSSSCQPNAVGGTITILDLFLVIVKLAMMI